MAPKRKATTAPSKRKTTTAPSKKKEIGASSSTPKFDTTRFRSVAKEHFFTHVLAHFHCVPERGIVYNKGVYDEFGIQEVLEKRRWELWVETFPEACEVLVWEFYANSRYDDQNNLGAKPPRVSWFRGTKITYNAETLRVFLGLPTPEEEQQLFSGSSYHDIVSTNLTPELKEEIKQTIV